MVCYFLGTLELSKGIRRRGVEPRPGWLIGAGWRGQYVEPVSPLTAWFPPPLSQPSFNTPPQLYVIKRVRSRERKRFSLPLHTLTKQTSVVRWGNYEMIESGEHRPPPTGQIVRSYESQESCENGPWSTVQLPFRQNAFFQQLAGKIFKRSPMYLTKSLIGFNKMELFYYIRFKYTLPSVICFPFHSGFSLPKGKKKSIKSNTWTNNTARPICSCRKLPTQELVMLMRRLIWYFWQSESTKSGPSSRSHSFCWLVN